jgi:hypothetical protein
MKTCKDCKQELPATLDFFTSHPSTKDKFNIYCKKCNKQRSTNNYFKNKNKRNAQVRKWQSENKEKVKEIWRRKENKRRSLIQNNGFEKYTEDEMISKYGTICYLCNKEIDLNAPRKSGKPGWEMSLWTDHVIAISNGGADTLENVRPSHGLCNSNKSNKEKYETQNA